jgi:hypothetical protein
MDIQKNDFKKNYLNNKDEEETYSQNHTIYSHYLRCCKH